MTLTYYGHDVVREDRPRLPVEVVHEPPVVVLAEPVDGIGRKPGRDLEELVFEGQCPNGRVKAGQRWGSSCVFSLMKLFIHNIGCHAGPDLDLPQY